LAGELRHQGGNYDRNGEDAQWLAHELVSMTKVLALC
jgi:hypothetical protein